MSIVDYSLETAGCHPERSSWFAQRSRYAVEGSLYLAYKKEIRKEFSHQSRTPISGIPARKAIFRRRISIRKANRNGSAQDDRFKL